MTRLISACAVLLFAAIGCISAEAQPLLNYKFNETTGTAAANDGSTGAGNNGTFTGAVTWGAGQIGSGAVTVPTTREMTTGGFSPGASSPGNLTVEFWLNTTTAVACGVLGSNALTVGQLAHLLVLGSGEISVLWDSSGGYMQLYGTTSVNTGTWVHVAFIINGGIPSLYVDGNLDPLTAFTGPPGSFPLVTSATTLELFDETFSGQGQGWGSFAGSMDEFRWWNVARTPSEIQQNYALEWGQTTAEINVRTPSNENVADGGTHRVPPRMPVSTTTLDWTIQNQHPTATLNIGTIALGSPQNCTVSITTDPSNTAILGGASATLSIEIVADAGVGDLSFTITIPNDDDNEDPYEITVQSTRGLSGALTINNGGGGDYTDIGSAFTDLETFGFADDVTFTVHDSGAGYTASASYELGSDNGTSTPAPVYGVAGATARFVAATGVRPQISGSFSLNTFAASFAITNMAITDVRDGTVAIEGLAFTGTTDANIVVFRDSVLRGNGGIQILRNHIHTNNAGMGIYAIHNGSALQNLEIENNFLWGHAVTVSTYHTSLQVPSNGIISFFNASANCRVEHNTIVQNGAGFPAAAAACLCIKGGAFNLGSMNYNIMQTLADGTKLVDIPAGRQPQTSDRNVFHLGGTGATFSALYTDLAAWNATTGLDGSSAQGDPLLASTTNLEINSGSSPAMDLAAGSATAVDVNGTGRPLGPEPDAGAHEYLNLPAVSISVPDADADEEGQDTGQYVITMSMTAATDTTINFEMSGTADATPGPDYALNSVGTVTFTGPGGTAVIPAGNTSITITLLPTDDSDQEGTETAIMTLQTGTGYAVGTPSQGTVNIADNDISTVTVAATTATADETGPTPGVYTLTMAPAPASPITVNFTMSGQASTTPGTDYNLSGTGVSYTGPTGSITIGAGVTSATITITPNDDSDVEGTETAILTLNANAGYVLGTPDNATVDILDNDVATTVSLAVTDPNAAEEGTATGTFELTLTPAPTGTLVVNFNMSGSASNTPNTDYNLSTSTAGAAVDFGAGTITVNAGVGTVVITLTPVDDSEVEGTETATMTLTAGAYTLGATVSGGIDIADNDIGVSLSVTDAAAAEATPATETGTYVITLTQAAAVPVTVNFTMSGAASTTPGDDYNLSGTGVTFTGPGGTVTIAAGVTTATITLTPVDDTAPESAEVATMTIETGTGYQVGTPSQGSVTIADNDAAGNPIVTVVSNGNASETGPTANTFTLTASPVPTGTITVNFTLTGTATIGADYTASSTVSVTIGFGGSATVTITPVDDTANEGTETVILTVTAGVGYNVGAPSSATMNITDNDAAPPGPTGGGGGGGGGCAAGTSNAPWLVLMAILAGFVAISRLRAARQ